MRSFSRLASDSVERETLGDEVEPVTSGDGATVTPLAVTEPQETPDVAAGDDGIANDEDGKQEELDGDVITDDGADLAKRKPRSWRRPKGPTED